MISDVATFRVCVFVWIMRGVTGANLKDIFFLITLIKNLLKVAMIL